jgi:type II secretory pathway component PulC
MKVINKENFFNLVPKLNVILIVTAGILTAGLYSSINRTYDSNSVRPNNKITRPLELMTKGAASDALPLFQEDIFKKKPLFNQPTNKKLVPEKKVFTLLGISMGKKNIAVIRDVKANKDYYCSVGDPVGDYQVKEILKDKVILESSSNETLEISR